MDVDAEENYDDGEEPFFNAKETTKINNESA